MELSKFSIKTFGVNFGNAILDNSNWDEISEGITKKSISGTQWDSLWEVKNRKPNPLIQTVLHRSIIYTTPKYIKKEIKGVYYFLWKRKNYDLPDT